MENGVLAFPSTGTPHSQLWFFTEFPFFVLAQEMSA
jgi:hypothetical protein